jgi:hypothetical protein
VEELFPVTGVFHLHGSKNHSMSVASFVVVTTLQTTRSVWSTRTSKRRHPPPLCPKIYNPPPNLKQTLNTQPGVTYAQIANSNSSSHPQTETEPRLKQLGPLQQPYQCNSAIQELKYMIKGLFEQLGTMLNLLTIVLGKLK